MLLLTDDQIAREFSPNSYSRRGKWELYGNNSLFKGRVWFVKDGLGICCAVFTWLLMFYAEVVVCGLNLFSAIFVRDSLTFGLVNLIGFNVVFALAFLAHVKTVFSNPGVVRKNNFEDEVMSLSQGTVISKCVKCESVKPQRAHHCSICDRCVHRMDHHCPWVNNCIGERNQKYFILFTFYIALMSVYTIFVAAHLLVVCTDSSFIGCTWLPPAATLILNIIVLFEGILFSMFTLTMCGTQICSIWYDETTIESLKQMPSTWMRRTRLHGMRSVFGHRFSWEWLSPLHSARMWWKEKMHHV